MVQNPNATSLMDDPFSHSTTQATLCRFHWFVLLSAPFLLHNQTYLAVGVGAAGCADLVPGEPAAGLEGVSGEAARAAADGDVAAHVAVGARAARGRARVDAVVVLARLLVAAVAVRHAVTAEALLQKEGLECLLALLQVWQNILTFWSVRR